MSTSTTDTHTHLDFDGDKEPDIGEFVLAKLVAEISANSYHYVAEVIDKDDPEFVVSFVGSQGNALEISSNQPLMALSILTGMVLSCACPPPMQVDAQSVHSQF